MNCNDKHEQTELQKLKQKTLQSLDLFIDSTERENCKKAENLVRWLKKYTELLKREKKFDPKFLPVYPYGSVIFADLGFNVGSEYGGPHYCVVLNQKDNKSSKTLNVVPMTSQKGKLHKPYILDIGDEFYHLLDLKVDTMNSSIRTNIEFLRDLINTLKNENTKNTPSQGDLPPDPFNFIENQIKQLQVSNDILEKCIKKADSLKNGSAILIAQITTISKMRIIDPQNGKDPLYNIILSHSTMDKITQKINNL